LNPTAFDAREDVPHMPKNQEKVMAFVQEELARNPEVATSELFEMAKKIDSGVKNLSLRQFNARFPLQIKRKQTLARPKRRPRGAAARRRLTAATHGRAGVREVFLRFAEDLSSAEERKDLVRVLAAVDRYVDDAIEALEPSGSRKKPATELPSERGEA